MVMVWLSVSAFLQRITMASPFIQYDELVTLSLDGGYNLKPALSNLSAVFLLSACLVLQQKYLWQNPIAPINEADYELILNMIDTAMAELMLNVYIGQIMPSVVDLSTSDGILLLDGSLIAQADYPELTALVPASWLVGADIQLPDMTEKSLHGQDGANLGTIIGENAVTLSVSEMPSHNHTQNPHAHSEIIPAVTPTGAGPVVAGASVVIPTPSTTGLATASNNAEGGDQAHNNIPESLTVLWFIIAR